jgi:methyl-accepting chemotaxis protein
VVADEVKKLSDKTGKSAKEISLSIENMNLELNKTVKEINQIVQLVEDKSLIAEKAIESIIKIEDSSKTTASIVSEITDAIREQGAAVNNIAVNVERIAQMSEESSAAADSSSDTAAALNKIAQDMRKIIEQYKI